MAGAYSTIVVRDGNGTVISGNMAALDQSGGGVHGMVMMVVQRLDPPQ